MITFALGGSSTRRAQFASTLSSFELYDLYDLDCTPPPPPLQLWEPITNSKSTSSNFNDTSPNDNGGKSLDHPNDDNDDKTLKTPTALITTRPNPNSMPICTSCTTYVPFLYTVYESAYNLRLEECTRCHAFADPYVEHDSLTLLLDLVLLKRGVYRHLLYNRGSEPRKACNNGKDVNKVPSRPERARRGKRKRGKKPWVDPREMRRWTLVFKLGVVFIFLDAYIRWCHLNPNPPSAGSPWTLDLFAHFSRVLLGCVVETVAFHSSIGFMCLISLAFLTTIPPSNEPGSTSSSDIRREFRLSLVPLTLFYSSLTKLLLLWLLTIWRPSTTPIPPPSFRIPISFLTSSNSPLIAPWREYIQKAFIALDDDKIDKEWFIRNILGGMSAGFGLRMILDTHPLVTTLIIVIGWAFKTLVATMVSHWVGGSERSGDAWLAYSIP